MAESTSPLPPTCWAIILKSNFCDSLLSSVRINSLLRGSFVADVNKLPVDLPTVHQIRTPLLSRDEPNKWSTKWYRYFVHPGLKVLGPYVSLAGPHTGWSLTPDACHTC